MLWFGQHSALRFRAECVAIAWCVCMIMAFTHTCFRVFFPPRPPKPKAYWFFAVVYPPTPLSRGGLLPLGDLWWRFWGALGDQWGRVWGGLWRPLAALLVRLWASNESASGALLGDL